MKKRVIQVPVDNELLYRIDCLTREKKCSRAGIIREACIRYLKDMQVAEQEQAYEAGYRKIPEAPHTGKAQEAILADSIGTEPW